jgi:hypothetical protein
MQNKGTQNALMTRIYEVTNKPTTTCHFDEPAAADALREEKCIKNLCGAVDTEVTISSNGSEAAAQILD